MTAYMNSKILHTLGKVHILLIWPANIQYSAMFDF
jgi:hypothetical protein